MMRKIELLTAALLLALALPVVAGTPDPLPTSGEDVAPASQPWRIDGGELRIKFNDSFLDLFGVGIRYTAAVRDVANPEYVVFPLVRSKGLEFDAPGGSFGGFGRGGLQARGGFQFSLPDGSLIDLRDPYLRAGSQDSGHLELVDASGTVWAYVNHLMYEMGTGYGQFHVRTSDIRASEVLAKRVGEPHLAGAYIGELLLDARVVQRGETPPALPKQALPKFHGTAHPDGGTYQTDVLMSAYDMQFIRCRRSDGVTNGCDGAGTDDGEVVFAPNATLRNSNTTRTADVPWYQKFTTSPYSYPYPGNDQHPYLIWNLYRIVDGQLEQIGGSGVKHAFLTTNVGCSAPFGGHILSPNCLDTYSTGNNDSISSLGPRVEILPASGIWGRCGSVFDTNCDGVQNSVGSCSGASKPCYDQRLVVRESQMLVPGAQFLSEAWYVVQDDINIYNTMARRTMAPVPGGGGWIPGTQGTFALGPVINSWVDPVAQPARNIELASDHGRVRVAVKVKTLDACPAGSGLSGTCYRYDYAVNNFDYAVSDTQGALPNLRVLGAKGFDRFRIEFGMRANVHVPESGHFADIDIDAGNDWSVSSGPTHVEWLAPAGNELDWGRLFRFSLVSTVAPVDADTVAVDLRPLNIGLAGSGLAGQIVGPAGVGEGIFSDSFE